MKKTYIIPTTDEIVLKACGQLLAGSETIPLGDSGSADNAEAPYFGGDNFFFED